MIPPDKLFSSFLFALIATSNPADDLTLSSPITTLGYEPQECAHCREVKQQVKGWALPRKKSSVLGVIILKCLPGRTRRQTFASGDEMDLGKSSPSRERLYHNLLEHLITSINALGFLGEWANKVIEPYRGLPFGSYLHTPPLRRQRRLSGPLDNNNDSIWHRLQIFSAVETEQHTSPQDQCLFLTRLPQDIRFMIYEMVLGGKVFHIQAKNTNDPHCRLLSWTCTRPELIYDQGPDTHIPCFSTSGTSSPTASRPSSSHNPYFEDHLQPTGLLPLLVTCRQIYTEAVPILYSNNTFEFTQNRTAFRFLKVMIPPPRLKDIRRFKWDVRLPYHPQISSRALKDWNDLFLFFSNETSSLQHLYLKLQLLHPMQADILRTPDDGPAAAAWIKPMLVMAIDANRRRSCKVEIVSNHVVLEPERIFKAVARENPGEMFGWILGEACTEMHRRIRLSLEGSTTDVAVVDG